MTSPKPKIGPDRGALDWPFFDEGHRALVRDADAWLAIGAARGDRSSRRGRGLPHVSSRSSARPACSPMSRPAPMAARGRRSICARSACCARRSPGMTGSPISPSRCRASARARSVLPAPRR